MRKPILALAVLGLLGAGAVRAADVPMNATKLIVVDKLEAASAAKSVFVAKDTPVTKGAGTDVESIDVRFDVVYDDSIGAFVLPAGKSDGTAGWLVNKDPVAKYVNKNDPAGGVPTGAKVAVIKPGKLLKIVGKTLGDEALDLVTDDVPDDFVYTAYRVINGDEVNTHCSRFPAAECSYKPIAGGTGRKLACKKGEPDPTCTAASASRTRLATFNVGLAQGFVPLATERQPEIAAALADSDFDILCLQEVFQDADVTAIVDAVSATYPYSYYELTDDPGAGGDPACTQAAVDPLLQCVADNNCEDPVEHPEGTINCGIENCAFQVLALSVNYPACFNCIAAYSSLPLEQIEQICLVESGTLRDNGRNGVVLLSKLPLVNTEYITFDAALVQRVALHAQVTRPDLGDVDVFCTHFTADLSGVPYGGNFGSYEEEQAAQVQGLLDWIDSVATTGQVVALGDFNTGPEILPDVVAALPDNYAGLIAGGLTSPYAEVPATACTFCEDNTLNGAGTDNVVIDHVFVNGLPVGTRFESERIFTELVEVDPGSGPQMTNLSDHYGVSVTVTPP